MHTGLEADEHTANIVTLEAVRAADRMGDTSIAAVAAQLGVDRSGASRMITAAADGGLVSKRTAEGDQRRTEVDITDAGHLLLERAHAWQADAFQAMTADWAPDDVEQFATHLVRLADHILHRKDQP